jgi:hypothetical protein
VGSISFICLYSLLTILFEIHPLHVSVTEIEMDEKDKRLEIMMRVFIDDLELTLRQNLHQPALDILSLSENGRDEIVSDYLKDHVKLSLDSKIQKIKYIGHEQEESAFIFYVEVSNVKKWKTIQVQNDIIMNTFSDQSNLVHVTVGEKVKSLRLTKSNPVDKLTFDF